MDSKGTQETIVYPHIVFPIDNFDDVGSLGQLIFMLILFAISRKHFFLFRCKFAVDIIPRNRIYAPSSSSLL